ncbi:MAG: glycosyltransferase [Chthoniobacterales bacterium]
MSTKPPEIPEKRFVFHDVGGKRWPRVRLYSLIGLLLFLTAIIVFSRSLFIAPQLMLPDSVRTLKYQLKALGAETTPVASAKQVNDWQTLAPELKAKAKEHVIKKTIPTDQVRLAYYVGWDPAAYESLKRNFQLYTHLSAEWFDMVDGEGKIVESPDTKVRSFAKSHGMGFFPILRNLDGDTWIPEAVEGIINGPAERQDRFTADIIDRLIKINADGVLVEWNEVDPDYQENLSLFIEKFAAALHEKNMQLWLSVPIGHELKLFDLDSLSANVDRFVAVLYDQNSEHDEPGPIASQEWFDGWLNVILGFGTPKQWIIAIGNFGYDWEEGQMPAAAISFVDAMTRASRAGGTKCVTSAPVYEPRYRYEEEGKKHTVAFLDAVTFANQVASVLAHDAGGFALYRLGTEDPGVSKVLEVNGKWSPALQNDLEIMASKREVASVGSGEFLTADLEHNPGTRVITMQPDGKLTESYTDFPQYITLFHQGDGGDNKVAITFDDGPDPTWTPKILEILKEKNVPAAFFLVGRQVEKYPGMLKKIVAAGHEVGNHTYSHANLALVSDQQIELELNVTTRLIESFANISTSLFRPPYNADSRPNNYDEIRSLAVAKDLGYITVAENIDPEDWERPGADAILQRVKDQRSSGNIVLLHDAGGDRSQTVEALPRIIDYLRSRGDTIVTLGELINQPKNVLMPPLNPEQKLGPRIAHIGLRIWQFTESFLWSFLIVTAALMLLRILFTLGLAFYHRYRQSHTVREPFSPPVTVVIAAYNEELVMRSTMARILESDYPNTMEVIVVNDGSKDKTGEILNEIAATDLRVRVIEQVNLGKAEALNRAIAESRHEVIVMLDADTQIGRESLRNLVAPLIAPKIGAVSGHILVGNHNHLISRFQAMEYLCGFNLDRRAFDVLNCITVVPGALSAYKKTALTACGPISNDTLAEDTDLTLTMHKKGWKISYAPDAAAWTEAPETFRDLVKQRFRWTFGTLQSLWKHRDLTLNPRYGALGLYALPMLWFFRIALAALSPIVDLMVIISIFLGNGMILLWYFLFFLGIDMLLAVSAASLEGKSLKRTFIVIPMRFIYSPVLSWVVWKCVRKALQGKLVGWGKFDRTASVAVDVPKAVVPKNP